MSTKLYHNIYMIMSEKQSLNVILGEVEWCTSTGSLVSADLLFPAFSCEISLTFLAMFVTEISNCTVITGLILRSFLLLDVNINIYTFIRLFLLDTHFTN